jgi:hypothetical protein
MFENHLKLFKNICRCLKTVGFLTKNYVSYNRIPAAHGLQAIRHELQFLLPAEMDQ